MIKKEFKGGGKLDIEKLEAIISSSGDFEYRYENKISCTLMYHLDLIIERKLEIDLDSLKSHYEEAKKEQMISPGVMTAYKFLKSQSKPCSSCDVNATSTRSKYILPCYCTLCEECLSNIADDLIKKEALKSTKQGAAKFEEELPRCRKHKLPFYVEGFTQLVSKKKQWNVNRETTKELIEESKAAVTRSWCEQC
eukprot:TRINITY_DN10099_c0_g2_i1.p1 TRINITY_DN10099_c0_g2~~TRINITY_DN10099_c0_g2_i1.p1  ORF type:complete len:195 (+),score=35.55 TRINITY_DN10099_c0_g2_i1:149-733(+)